MKKWMLLLAAVLLLSACGPAGGPVLDPAPDPVPETAAPEAPPEPEPASAPTARDVAQWLTNPNNYVFSVYNGLDDHIITVEHGETEHGLTLNVWTADSPDAPLQTISMPDCEVYDRNMQFGAMVPNSDWFETVQDFNFDGHEDFGCCYREGNQPRFYHVWLWDESAGQYVLEPVFDELCTPDIDWIEEKILCWMRGGMAGSQGDYSIYQWVDGTLTEVRHIKLDYEDYMNNAGHYVSVTDLIDGEMQEVFRYDGNDWLEAIEPWFNLWYPET